MPSIVEIIIMLAIIVAAFSSFKAYQILKGSTVTATDGTPAA